MSIKELFEHAIDQQYTDLQALIMFLVFEKKVLDMSDDTNELDIYFLEKHNKRMNQELMAYKNKMGIEYGNHVFSVSNNNETIFVLANSFDQAKLIASRHYVKYNEVIACDMDTEMEYKESIITLRDVAKGKENGILGGYKH